MTLPSSADYISTSNAELRRMQEQLVIATFLEFRDVNDFEELSARLRRFMLLLRDRGFEFLLLDEDGESMISYGATFGTQQSITIQAYWDDRHGSSAALTFRKGAAHVVIAVSPEGEMRELESSMGKD